MKLLYIKLFSHSSACGLGMCQGFCKHHSLWPINGRHMNRLGQTPEKTFHKLKKKKKKGKEKKNPKVLN